MELETATLVVPSGRAAEDRVGVFDLGRDTGSLVLLVADGAGGTGGAPRRRRR